MELAVSLHEEAQATDERRMLVLSGDRRRTREYVQRVLDAIDVSPADTTYVGRADSPHCERLNTEEASRLLGTTREVVVLDCHERCEPNVIGQLVGVVDGGGLFVLLTPALDSWPQKRDAFDDTLAVPPFDRADVTGQFRKRLVGTLRSHRGIAIVDVDADAVERDGHVQQAPSRPTPELTLPPNPSFPRDAYERCLTQDQVDALEAFKVLLDPGEALVVAANRGRGKSSAAGLAAASLALAGNDVLVTAPRYRSASELFARARELLDGVGELTAFAGGDPPRRLDTERGRVRFCAAGEATALPDDPDRVIVDEAAALPVRFLSAFLDAPGVAFTTTVHGYEGTGRGFSVRFCDRLDASNLTVTDVQLNEPIRYAPADPIEVWSFRALALDAGPAVAQLVEDGDPESVTYRTLSTAELVADEHLLREVFGLLVLAHYRTEPNDLARLLDGPNVSVHALLFDGHVVSVALLAREGNLPATLRSSTYEGSRIRGNLVPDVLTSQLRDEEAGKTVGLRVMRIATHGAVRSRGLGSRLLSEVAQRADVDWLGVGYGATPQLVGFWDDNGFSTVHLSTTRNERSGEHSAIMLSPLTPAGESLLERHTGWFLRRFPDMLVDSLAAVDPDIVRAVCRTIDGMGALDLSPWEWRHAAAVAYGPGIFEMAPGPIRQLAFRYLTDSTAADLSEDRERLLVRRVLQATHREEVATELGYHSESEAMRALGAAVETLLDRYGGPEVENERERLR